MKHDKNNKIPMILPKVTGNMFSKPQYPKLRTLSHDYNQQSPFVTEMRLKNQGSQMTNTNFQKKSKAKIIQDYDVNRQFVYQGRNEILKDELDPSPVKGFLVKSTLWSKQQQFNKVEKIYSYSTLKKLDNALTKSQQSIINSENIEIVRKLNIQNIEKEKLLVIKQINYKLKRFNKYKLATQVLVDGLSNRFSKIYDQF